ncbi:MAG: RHS repeat protein, partial [Planctomycetaceae bacterium]|nr:RHS repeat protein [Planctomycetaceae bacterium]
MSSHPAFAGAGFFRVVVGDDESRGMSGTFLIGQFAEDGPTRTWQGDFPDHPRIKRLSLRIRENREARFDVSVLLEHSGKTVSWQASTEADITESLTLSLSELSNDEEAVPRQITVTPASSSASAPNVFRISAAPTQEELAAMSFATGSGSPASSPSICDCNGCRIVYYEVTVQGVSPGDECGNDCLAANGTWILENEQPHNLNEVCGWIGPEVIGACDFQEPFLTFPSTASGHAHPCEVSVYFTLGGIDSPAWKKDFGPGEWPPLNCLAGPIVLPFWHSSFDYCNYSGSTATVTPILPADFSLNAWEEANCLGRSACPVTVPIKPPSMGDEVCTLEEQCCCPSCGCVIREPPIPGPKASGSCGCTGTINPRNGNLSIALPMPSAGRLAAVDSFTLNSSPSFDHCTAAGCSAGRGTSSTIQRFVGGGPTSNIAVVVKCDGSEDWYHCPDPSTGIYVAYPGVGNLLQRLFDSFNVFLGWKEISGPKTYWYADDGFLTRIELDCGDGTILEWLFSRNSPLSHITDPFGRRTTYTYDGAGHLQRVEDPFNRLTTFVVDSSGYLKQHITPELCTTEFRYNGSQQLSSTISPEGLRTTYSWDSNGWCSGLETPSGDSFSYEYVDLYHTKVTTPEGAITTLTHDMLRNVVSVIDPTGSRNTWIYNGILPLAHEDPLGSRSTLVYAAVAGYGLRIGAQVTQHGRTSYVYDGNGKAIAQIDAMGHRTTSVRDTNGKRIASVNALQQRTSFTYSAYGVQSVTNPLGQRSTTVFDSIGQVLASVNPLGFRTTYTYVHGQRQSVIDPLGTRTTTLFDNNNRLVATVDPLGNRTTNVYDAGCKPVAQINPLGARSTTVYAYGRVAANISPLGDRTSIVYDDNGRRLATVSPMGHRSTMVYDAAGRVVAAINPSLLRTTTVYDAAGRAIASIAPTGLRTTTVYDSCCSRPRATIQPNGARTSIVYNAAGQQIRTVSPTGAITTTIYDALNRASATVDSLGHRSSTVFDAAGRSVATVNALNQRNSTVYDAAGQAVASINAGGLRNTQVYDAAGRNVASINPIGSRWTTIYDLAGRSIASLDPLNRRTSTIFNAGGAAVASIDATGNRSTTVYNIGGQPVASVNAQGGRSTTIYNSDGQSFASINVLGYRSTSVYDASGRPVASINANGSRATTVYDSKGRSVASINPLGNRWTTVYNNVGQTASSLDPLGNRTTNVYDSAGRVIASINPLGHRSTTVFNAAGQALATVDGNGNRTSSVYDALGRRITEINALGYRTTTIYNSLGQTSALVDARG